MAALDISRGQRLRALATGFLQRKAITPVAGLQFHDTDRAVLAALCCLPLLRIGADVLRGWSELVVYPDAFRISRSHLDAAGVVHDGIDEVIGESLAQGTLILS